MSNFLKDYLTYSTQDEAPELFHLLAGYTALSGAIGRRVWLIHGENAFFPNIYTLLVGTAGCGKNQAINKCMRMLKALDNVAISASVETSEGIIRYIAGDPTKNPPIVSETEKVRLWRDGSNREVHELVIFATEFIDFIRVDPEKWTGLLNNIYDTDEKYSYRTKGCGTDNIIGPYIVLLGGIPTNSSKQLQELGVIDSGFARRTLLQYGKRQHECPRPFPTYTKTEDDARLRCLDRLRHIQTFSGELKLSPEATQWWIDWYTDHSLTIEQRSTPSTQGWYASKPMQVQKLAMLNSLACRDDLLITPDEFELAASTLANMEKGFNMIFGGMGKNELAALAVCIQEYLQSIETQEIPLRTFEQLQTKFFTHFTSGKGFSELQEVLKYLVATDAVVLRPLTVRGLSQQYYTTPVGLQSFLAHVASQVSDATRPPSQ